MNPVTVQGLRKSYGATLVLRDVSLAVAQSECVVICGPSGSGKSTLVRCIAQLEPFQCGEIVVNGTTLRPQADRRAARTGVGMVFQHFNLFPHLSALHNCMLAQQRVLGTRRAEAETTARHYLARVGLADKADALPHALSGGQKQRVAIARCLSMRPSVVVMDEPTSALDPEMVQEVLAIMTELGEAGMTMMCVTHEMGFARSVADRVAFMEAGQIVEVAEAGRFFDHPASERTQQFLAKVL